MQEKSLKAKIILAGKSIKFYKKLFADYKYKLNDYFRYIGTYNQDFAPIIYNKADAYIMLKYLDPCPNTVIEAMACGLPILYSKSGGLTEIVGKNCGYGMVVEENWEKKYNVPEVNDIGNGMIEIAKNCETMGFNSRKRAIKNHNLEKWINRHKIIFKKYKSK